MIAEGLKQPNGVAFKDGALYVITIDKVLRFDGIEDKLDNPQPTDISQTSSTCRRRRTTTGSLRRSGPTTRSIFDVGAPCNICEIDPGKYG